MTVIGGVDLGDLTNYLFFFADGNQDANWQGATKGFVGDVAVDGIQADERTSGSVPYAGTISTNDTTLDAWQDIVDQNPLQASSATGQVALISGLEADLISAFQQINALAPTPGFESVSSTSLDGLDTTNGIDEVFVINITSDLSFSSQINITGDPGDVFILRWDTDGDPTNGYQGQVKPQSGGAIVPQGGLEPGNFINVAGDINASGGGTTPPPPYPQGPRFDDGQGALINGGEDFSGGGFFTGYWLTTGDPTFLDPDYGLLIGETQSLSNGIFVGGWYTLTTKFSMTSGTSGVYVSPNPATTTAPAIDIEKLVSPNNGGVFEDADSPTGPLILSGTDPQFKYVVTNTGNERITNITVTDTDFTLPALPQTSLDPGESFDFIITEPWAAGQHTNIATVNGVGDNSGIAVTDSDSANYFGTTENMPSIDVEKLVSPDNGVTFEDADTAPGPIIVSSIDPIFKYVITNTGSETITNIELLDDVYAPSSPGISLPKTTLAPGESIEQIITPSWVQGQRINIATVTGDGETSGTSVTDSDPANYFGTTADIDVEKLVFDETTSTFVDADTPPFPTVEIGTDPLYRFIVTNTGDVDLTTITLVDNVLGNISIPAGTLPLAVGDSFTVDVTGDWAPGEQCNLVTATGTAVEDNVTVTVTDTDPACYVGISEPDIDVEKLVSPDGGATFEDADTPPGPTIFTGTDPVFKYVVTNTGNEPLTDITLSDSDLGSITIPTTTLAPGESFEAFATGSWSEGEQSNTATVQGTGITAVVTDTDPANYLGASQVRIDIEKLVSVDNGETFVDVDNPPGPYLNPSIDPIFRYVVTNNGNTPLTDIVVTDSELGSIGNIPELLPGDVFEFEEVGTGEIGQQSNIGFAEGAFEDETVSDSDLANYFGIPEFFTQKLVNGNLIIPEEKPDVEELISENVEIIIDELFPFEAIEGIKIKVKGRVKIEIVYVADVEDDSQPVHSAHFEIPFKALIKGIELGQCISLDPIVILEHQQFHLVDARIIKKAIVVFVGVRTED